MISTTVSTERAVASIFNSAVAAGAIGAAWEVGLLDAVRSQKRVNIELFAKDRDLDLGSTHGLATTLVVADILERQDDFLFPGRLMDEAYRNKSLFHWLCLGSGGLFSRMQYVLQNKNRQGEFYERDSVAIAYACHDINKEHFDPYFWEAMDGLDFKINTVVDLGSGSGQRLMQILDKFPGTSGIGIDIAGPATKVAESHGKERGLGDRLSFVVGDATNLSYQKEFEDVNLVTSFLMGHDFWPRENCIASMKCLKKAFPNARRLLLGDTTRVLLHPDESENSVTEDDVPIFTLGFEFGHAMMGTYLPTVKEWEGVFDQAGWRCVKKHVVDSSYPSVIFELEHA
jgi:SAM-dependent methyltransferase